MDPLAEELPSTELLSLPPVRNVDAGRRSSTRPAQKLMEALRTFSVDGELVGRTTGPTVTQFEIEPAPGVKVRQFANLANDLALAMRAPCIRIVAPIPGQGRGGRRSAESDLRDGRLPRTARERATIHASALRAAHRARQGPRGASR